MKASETFIPTIKCYLNITKLGSSLCVERRNFGVGKVCHFSIEDFDFLQSFEAARRKGYWWFCSTNRAVCILVAFKGPKQSFGVLRVCYKHVWETWFPSSGSLQHSLKPEEKWVLWKEEKQNLEEWVEDNVRGPAASSPWAVVFACCIRKWFRVSLAANVDLKHMEEKREAVPVSVFIKLQNRMDMGQGIQKSAMGLRCGYVLNFKSG